MLIKEKELKKIINEELQNISETHNVDEAISDVMAGLKGAFKGAKANFQQGKMNSEVLKIIDNVQKAVTDAETKLKNYVEPAKTAGMKYDLSEIVKYLTLTRINSDRAKKAISTNTASPTASAAAAPAAAPPAPARAADGGPATPSEAEVQKNWEMISPEIVKVIQSGKYANQGDDQQILKNFKNNFSRLSLMDFSKMSQDQMQKAFQSLPSETRQTAYNLLVKNKNISPSTAKKPQPPASAAEEPTVKPKPAIPPPPSKEEPETIEPEPEVRMTGRAAARPSVGFGEVKEEKKSNKKYKIKIK